MSEVSTERRPLRSGPLVGGVDAAWDRLLRSAPLLRPPAKRTVVVSPHPDDEALSSGGLIMHQLARGVPVVVVAVTDGEAAYPTWSDPGLAATRRDEQRTALGILGVSAAATVRLGLPDSAVAAHLDELTARLGEIIEPGDLVVAPWRHDWHPDHAACARATEHLVRTRSCTLFGSLFWAFHRVDPTDHPNVRIAGLHLSEDDSMWRWEAIQSHASQFDAGDQAPILDRPLVERLSQPIEYYVVKP